MLYLPLLVFVGVTVWIAGWRKALEITGVSLFICLIFGVGFGVLMPLSALPRILIAATLLVLCEEIWRRRRQHDHHHHRPPPTS
jgi:hypothetical protein